MKRAMTQGLMCPVTTGRAAVQPSAFGNVAPLAREIALFYRAFLRKSDIANRQETWQCRSVILPGLPRP
jgi:hypothetical protein